MKLLLSSDAAPDASLDGLTRACERRALGGLELRLGAGHRHGLGDALCPVREQAGVPCASEEHAPVRWLRLPPGASPVMRLIWASGAHRLEAGLILPAPVSAPPLSVPLALVHPTDPARAEKAADWARRYRMGTCWSVAAGRSDPTALADVLEATGDTLSHVRLLGAGPEAQASDAAEAHPLWRLLAMYGYSGTVALAPSFGANLEEWRRWLFERRGWGCNTAAEKAAGRAPSSTRKTATSAQRHD